MTVESQLTRRLGITFLDARALATEAKLNQGITGYPNKAQVDDLIEEAIRIFRNEPEEYQTACQEKRNSLDNAKNSMHSVASSVCSATERMDDTSVDSRCSQLMAEREANRKEKNMRKQFNKNVIVQLMKGGREVNVWKNKTSRQGKENVEVRR